MILRRNVSGWKRLPWRRLLTAVLAAAAIVVYWTQLGDRGARVAARDLSSSTATGNRAGIGFVNERRLDEHYEKHGGEFGGISKQDYLRLAQQLRDAEIGDTVLQTVRSDGVTTRFDRQTGAFVAINRDGTIRTFFKPNDGERYYRRQAERVGE